jgi:hypothetical protein
MVQGVLLRREPAAKAGLRKQRRVRSPVRVGRILVMV